MGIFNWNPYRANIQSDTGIAIYPPFPVWDWHIFLALRFFGFKSDVYSIKYDTYIYLFLNFHKKNVLQNQLAHSNFYTLKVVQYNIPPGNSAITLLYFKCNVSY